MGGLAPVNKGLGINFASVDSSQQHELGIEVACNDGTVRRYVRAGATIVQYDALTVDFAEGSYDVQPTSAVTHPVVGVAPYAATDNYFLWAIVKGKATCKVAASPTAGLHLVATAVSGTLDVTAASAANALTAAQGRGVTCIVDDTPSAGLATVLLS